MSVTEGTGEAVSYQYDRLKRLISSSSTLGWSQSYSYDGFGNLTSRSPGLNVLADPGTNRMVGSGGRYDANGNFCSGNWAYDVENRLVSDDAGGGEQYVYDASNKRVYRQNDSSQINGGGEWYYFYGLDGKVMGEYSVNWGTTQNVYGPMSLNRVTEWAYFGGKTVVPGVAHDRLGSPRGNASAAYYPYGENYVSPGPSEEGFTGWVGGTQAGLSYADQRYYSSQYGRFNTPDRYKASGGPSDPGSWNRYSYVGGDPVNYLDPRGRERNVIGDDGPGPSCDDSDPTCEDDGQDHDDGTPEGAAELQISLPDNTGQKNAGLGNLASYQRAFDAMKTFSTTKTNCLTDLDAVGLKPDQVRSLASGAQFVSFTNASAYNQDQALRQGADLMTDRRIQTIYYVDPNLAKESFHVVLGELLHEVIHLSGFAAFGASQDTALQNALHVTVGAPTMNISKKLAKDCFKGAK
jgi:RHS repeat-associated protein